MVACLRRGAAARGCAALRAWEAERAPKPRWWWNFLLVAIAVILGCQGGLPYVLIGLVSEDNDGTAGRDSSTCSCDPAAPDASAGDPAGEPGAKGSADDL